MLTLFVSVAKIKSQWWSKSSVQLLAAQQLQGLHHKFGSYLEVRKYGLWRLCVHLFAHSSRHVNMWWPVSHSYSWSWCRQCRVAVQCVVLWLANRVFVLLSPCHQCQLETRCSRLDKLSRGEIVKLFALSSKRNLLNSYTLCPFVLNAIFSDTSDKEKPECCTCIVPTNILFNCLLFIEIECESSIKFCVRVLST